MAVALSKMPSASIKQHFTTAVKAWSELIRDSVRLKFNVLGKNALGEHKLNRKSEISTSPMRGTLAVVLS